MTSSPPTLEQVAALAGVSRATVSRVVNGSPKVSPEARAQVERAVAKLGYVPNRAARSLVTRRADSVALVVSESHARFFSEPFFAGMVRGVSAALAGTGVQLLLLIAQDLPDRSRLERYVVGGHVDGVLLASLHGDDPLPATLERAGVPAVLVGRPAGPGTPGDRRDPSTLRGGPGGSRRGGPPEDRGARASYVDADNRGGARAAVLHLAARGRRRIATVTGPLDMGVGLDRLDGYRDGLAAAGLAADPALVEPGDFTEEGGAAATVRLLARPGPPVDAVFAASDLMAAGALRALRAAGRRVPEEVAVVGFEDSAVARCAQPPLTTVRQPIEEMGRQATRLLLATVAGEATGAHLTLDTELVVRAST
ncbi:MAG TPA: LacI family DNA-binding transcriptional regulator [Actinomycetota bacterium]|jgi:DNA-binding LacI/PurR family transcriptional regulator|nr:LacI family DNA-binding transcriptional regulator [Actinomycetota bacterium]